MIVTLRDGLRIGLRELGSADALPPLLLLHGFSGCGGSWTEIVLDRLAESRRVVAVDLPGHGASDIPTEPGRFAFAAIVSDLVDLLDVLDITSAVWIGYSMGGRLALGAGLLAPDRVSKLVLESASPGLATESDRIRRRTADEELARHIETRGIEWFAEAWGSQPLFETQKRLPADTRNGLRRGRAANRPDGLAACLRGLGTGMQPSLWDALGHVSAPTLLIAGEEDHKFVTTNRRMLAGLPDARLELVPGAGHRVHLERPDVWLPAVESFV